MAVSTWFKMEDSDAELCLTLSGDVGGNAQSGVIEVKGGQFEGAQVEKTENGFRINIVGTWELAEFAEALGLAVQLEGRCEHG